MAADGKLADRTSTLQRIIRSHKPGETVDLEVIRFGAKRSFKVKLIEAPSEVAAVAANARANGAGPAPVRRNADGIRVPKLGITVEPVSDQMAREAKLTDEQRGVLITSKDPNSPAARAFFADRSEIIIASLFPRPRRDVRNADDLADVVAKMGSTGTLQLLVYRIGGGGTGVVTLRLGEQE